MATSAGWGCECKRRSAFCWIRCATLPACRLLSVSVGADNRLPYAWLDGANRGHAVAVFDGQQIPDRLLAEIRKLKANGDTAVRST